MGPGNAIGRLELVDEPSKIKQELKKVSSSKENLQSKTPDWRRKGSSSVSSASFSSSFFLFSMLLLMLLLLLLLLLLL